jgi:hypothetical protein
MSESRKPRKRNRRSAPSSAFQIALAKIAMVRIADREQSELTDADRAKLKALEAAWKRDGRVAFDRLRESDFLGYFRIVASLNPKAMREALEEEILNLGMTNREFLAMARKKAQQKH